MRTENASLRIGFVAAEMAPLAKVGGLGDVTSALARELAARGHTVTVLLPAYGNMDRSVLADNADETVTVPWNGGERPVKLVRARLGDVEVALLNDPVVPEVTYRHEDDGAAALCYGLLCRLAATWLAPRCDLLHLHDHHSALVVPMLDEPSRPATLFTVHNLFFQGIHARQHLAPLRLQGRARAALDWSSNRFNAMRGAVLEADAVTTVSPTYAREILTPEFGCGLQAELASRGDALHGILNGIDTAAWDPSRDPHLAALYSADDLSGKRTCRSAVAAEMGLPAESERPLIGVVSRLTHQKGLDLLLPALAEIARRADICLLGSGDAELERALREAAGPHVAVRIGFDEPLAHRIEAGADLFLMPSRFEPCGLNQMISMRYGTLPVVRRTGGLADTVVDADEHPADGFGFVFEEAGTDPLRSAVLRALDALSAGRGPTLARRAMGVDVSWTASAVRYESLMADLVLGRRRRTSVAGSP